MKPANDSKFDRVTAIGSEHIGYLFHSTQDWGSVNDILFRFSYGNFIQKEWYICQVFDSFI
jgi:hypothetical protein